MSYFRRFDAPKGIKVEVRGSIARPHDEALMKSNQNCVVIFGHDEHLLVTRQWVLQSRGYRVFTIGDASEMNSIPQEVQAKVLLLCHSLTPRESMTAKAVASARWPEIRSVSLVAESGRAPAGILGQLLHTMDGPAKLISIVGELVGNSPTVGGPPAHH